MGRWLSNKEIEVKNHQDKVQKAIARQKAIAAEKERLEKEKLEKVEQQKEKQRKERLEEEKQRLQSPKKKQKHDGGSLTDPEDIVETPNKPSKPKMKISSLPKKKAITTAQTLNLLKIRVDEISRSVSTKVKQFQRHQSRRLGRNY